MTVFLAYILTIILRFKVESNFVIEEVLFLSLIMKGHSVLRRARYKNKRSDSGPWRKSLHPQQNLKRQRDNTKRHQKLWLHNDCGPT